MIYVSMLLKQSDYLYSDVWDNDWSRHHHKYWAVAAPAHKDPILLEQIIKSYYICSSPE
ncbi:hypothetical protein NC651_026693 [Populus alba x Populus x berolinensis]|nr:hypothetical protein NC651_026693 [Populus alba x Populus x berolinensis]